MFKITQAYVFSPFDKNTIGYNPLHNCKTEFEVRKIASIILDNGMSECKDTSQKEWVDMAKPLFTAYMLYNWKFNKYNFDRMVYNICTKPIVPEYKIVKNEKGAEKRIPNPNKSIVEEIMESRYISAIADLQMFLQVMGANNTLSSIRVVMNTCLQMFMDENLEHIFNNETIDLSRIRDEESIVYIQIPERHSEYYKPLVATFVSQLIDALLDKDGLQTYLMFDEFCNIGKIPNMCQLLSTARKHKVSIIAAIQNITQLTRRYNEIEGKELQELFKTILVCAGLKDSAEYFSKIIGKKKINKDKNTTYEDVMSEDKIRCMSKNEILIICDNKRPIIDRMCEIVC